MPTETTYYYDENGKRKIKCARGAYFREGDMTGASIDPNGATVYIRGRGEVRVTREDYERYFNTPSTKIIHEFPGGETETITSHHPDYKWAKENLETRYVEPNINTRRGPSRQALQRARGEEIQPETQKRNNSIPCVVYLIVALLFSIVAFIMFSMVCLSQGWCTIF